MKSIYYRAAEEVARGPYFCCHEIHNQCLFMNEAIILVDRFTYFFHPDTWNTNWFGDPRKKENQLARSLALLFMDLIKKEGRANGI